MDDDELMAEWRYLDDLIGDLESSLGEQGQQLKSDYLEGVRKRLLSEIRLSKFEIDCVKDSHGVPLWQKLPRY
jgi:hypothetical protein